MPKILVINREEKIRSIVKQHLVKANHEVIEAESTETAIEKIENGDNSLTVDAAICNFQIPEIDGMEAINYFQRKHPDLALIVTTTFADVLFAQDLLRNWGGVKTYILNPIEKESLLAAVNKAVNGHGPNNLATPSNAVTEITRTSCGKIDRN
jgi:two-component system response regulator ResD